MYPMSSRAARVSFEINVSPLGFCHFDTCTDASWGSAFQTKLIR